MQSKKITIDNFTAFIQNNTLTKLGATKGISKNIYYYNQIPEKKLNNAIKKYADINQDEEQILILYDDTLFGSAKEGFIITTKHIYYALPPKIASNIINGKLSFATISNMEIKNGIMLSTNIMVNHEQFICIQRLDKNDKLFLTDFINEFINKKNISDINGNVKEITRALKFKELIKELNLEVESLSNDLKELFIYNHGDKQNQIIELLVRDILTIANICGYADGKLTHEGTYAVAYLLANLLNNNPLISKLNSLANLDETKIQKAINDIYTSQKKLIDKYKKTNELSLPKLLYLFDKQNDTDYFDLLTMSLLKFASLVINADGKATEQEKAHVQHVYDLLFKDTKDDKIKLQKFLNKNESTK